MTKRKAGPRFQDIQQFIGDGSGSYAVDISWGYLEDTIAKWIEHDGLNIDPDFQRGHVWSREKQIRYVEFCLRGGRSARDLLFNCPGWTHGGSKPGDEFVLVDGKQRLEAVRLFMRSELPVFGDNLFRDYTDSLRMVHSRFRVCVNELATRREVLQWYLELNSGGVIHTEEELERVRLLLDEENRKGTKR